MLVFRTNTENVQFTQQKRKKQRNRECDSESEREIKGHQKGQRATE